MKTVLKALLPIALCAASSAYATVYTCGGHGQSSYYYDTAPKGTKVKITLQGAGSAQVNGLLPPDASVGQYFDLKSDCTFTSVIYADIPGNPRQDVFTITGTWDYPAESKAIYFALDGDITQGSSADPTATTWGRLMTGTTKIPFFMPIIFGTKISGFDLVYPSLATKKATIIPGKEGKAKASMSIIGKGIITNTKGQRKEASFSFTSTVNAVEGI